MCKVSVIIPVYNSEKYLEKCLDSLINQNLEDIEIIIVNDGSTDNSESIIKDYAKKDNRITFINKKNGGQASARNIGLRHAKGKYISFVDSDDYVDKNIYVDLLSKQEENKYDIIVFNYNIVEPEKEKYIKVLKDKDTGEIECKDFFFADMGPCNKIYKREFLVENKFAFPEGMIYEDYAAIASLVRFNPSIYYVNDTYYYYCQSDESTMRKSEYNKKYEDIFRANEILYNDLKGLNYDKELEYTITYHMLFLGSLNFYAYEKYEMIDRISNFIHKKFNKWYKNSYLKDETFKTKLLMFLFYKRRYNIIKFIQKMKR